MLDERAKRIKGYKTLMEQVIKDKKKHLGQLKHHKREVERLNNEYESYKRFIEYIEKMN